MRSGHLHRGFALLCIVMLLGGCAAIKPEKNAPPSADHPWKSPDLPAYSAALRAGDAVSEKNAVAVDSERAYDLGALIDIAQRTNPETRIAWERARQAAIGVGLVEGTYFPLLAAVATGAIAHVPTPIPTTVVPGGVFDADTQFFIPKVTLDWLVFDFGGRGALYDAAKAKAVGAAVAFNATHQKIVFEVTRNYYALSAASGKVNAERAAVESARTLEAAADARSNHGLATVPEVLQAREETARAVYALEEALAGEHDARMTLLDSLGVRPNGALRIVDVSSVPLPPALEQSVDDAIDRALSQRPDLLAHLAGVRAKAAEVRVATADFWPRLVFHAAVGENIGELKVGSSEYQTVSDPLYDAGLRLEWTLFDGFEKRNKLRLAMSSLHEAENELESAKDKAVREVWKAYNDTKVAIAKHEAAVALLAASEKAWDATLDSYRQGLATFPDVREAERNLAQARTLDQASRAEVLTRAAAFAFSTGDLAAP